MPRRAPVAPLLAALLLGAIACGLRGDARDVDVATGVASEFLKTLDADAAGAWIDLASPLRDHVTESDWTARIATMRAPLGKAIARELERATYAEGLVDAPPGSYFVVEFASQFSRARCRERVVATFENGAWRVAGYFVLDTKPNAATP
jgi:hypothetical protein